MTVEEIIRGESKNVEFKEILPNNSERYTKTIVLTRIPKAESCS